MNFTRLDFWTRVKEKDENTEEKHIAGDVGTFAWCAQARRSVREQQQQGQEQQQGQQQRGEVRDHRRHPGPRLPVPKLVCCLIGHI